MPTQDHLNTRKNLMRISIILEYKNDRADGVIERITRDGNSAYLVKGEDNKDYPYLAEVENYDYSVFDCTDMDAIIKELQSVKNNLSDVGDRKHIDDIIRLALKCKNDSNKVLVFAG